MKRTDDLSNALVSVIIPCYNHARFLDEAIASVQQQTYRNIEIIVVDDGSTDDTKAVASRHPDVICIHQKNAGLSAARNRGIDQAKGEYLVFLDADDYLYSDAIEYNLKELKGHPEWAFVSGWHDKVDEWRYPVDQDELEVVSENHYEKLLFGNYIGMHATVMYQRWVFDEFRYDTSLKACEDYDLYLSVTRKYPVGSHNHKIAAYRIHGTNMSAKIPFMLRHVLLVLDRQTSRLANANERQARISGIQIWKDYYISKIYENLVRGLGMENTQGNSEEIKLLREYNWKWFLQYKKKTLARKSRTILKNRLPDRALKYLFKKGFFKEYTPPEGKVHPGDFERYTPFSYDFGFDRGGAIDRYYIEKFLASESEHIHGRILEIGDNEYTLRFGETRVKQSDILHIDAENKKATIIGDLSNAPQIADNTFDCLVLTQTLQFIYDFKAALHTCYRILKPGGTLLLTVPGISNIDRGAWKDYWFWAFTDKSMAHIMKETFPGQQVEIKTYGNVYVASAFLYGMGLPEFNSKYLDYNDSSYQVIISVKAVKS
jgi:glycosyltransferase involved in cell wall biosynthesis